MVFRDGRQAWGGMALFRGPDDDHFDEDEIEFLASLSGQFARGVRTGMLSRLADAPPPTAPSGPAVLIVGSDNEIVQMSLGAEERIADLISRRGRRVTRWRRSRRWSAPPGATRAASWPRRRGRGCGAPAACGSCCTPRRSRRSATAAATWSSPSRRRGRRRSWPSWSPPSTSPPRERDVTQLVLQGVDTKEIAATLHVSTYTVQDHLKSVFDKADVRSRRELISRIYFDQYVPRMGTELSPSGWFSAS